MSRVVCRFLDAGNERRSARAQLTGVQKAPRHEVAGSWALAGQRVLWGFDVGTDLDDRRGAGRIRPACLHEQEIGGGRWAFLWGLWADRRTTPRLMGAT